MIKSDYLQLVSLLCKGGSIAAAARTLHLTPSAISQRLSQLEEKLGLSVAERFGRSGIRLTAEGEFLAQQADDVLNGLALIQDQLNQRRGVISGVVRVTAPFGFGRRHVAPALAEFHAMHPQVCVHLKLSDDLSRAPPTAWDILIRVSPWVDSSLVATELSSNRRIVCASPDYVATHGSPQSPHDLAQHRCISITEDGAKTSTWEFRRPDGKQLAVKVAPQLSTNDGETALDWAISGRGIVVRSQWSAASAIQSGKLLELMPGWTAPDAPIVALTSISQSRSSRVQATLKHLRDRCVSGNN